MPYAVCSMAMFGLLLLVVIVGLSEALIWIAAFLFLCLFELWLNMQSCLRIVFP